MAGPKPDKKMRDALMVALERETEDENGKSCRYYTRIAANLVSKAAVQADIAAIKEIFDRVDGKAIATVETGDQLTEALKAIKVTFGS